MGRREGRSGVAVASPAMHRSIICSTVKPCASMIASVAPLREDASSSSARRRSGLVYMIFNEV
jgi:hypothetical protein